MTKRVLAFLLAVVMVMSLLPVSMITAEGAEPGYAITLQRAHNQTEGKLTVDVYLKANTADQGDVTGFEFTVATAEGVSAFATAAIADAEFSGGGDQPHRFLYNPATEPAIAVGERNVLVATIELTGENLPAQLEDALTLTDVIITQPAPEKGENDEEEPVAPRYEGAAVPVTYAAYSCTDHACGHDSNGWQEFKLPAVSNSMHLLSAGKYYLTGNVTLSAYIALAENANVTICLNGYDIIGKEKVNVFKLANANSTLNICDCTATGTGVDYTSGKLYYNNYWGGCFRTDEKMNGTINVYGGTIDGSKYTQTNFSASIAYIIGPATFNMYGGKVVNARGNNAAGAIILRGCTSGEVSSVIKDVTFVGCANGMMTADSGGSGTAASKPDKDTLIVENVTVINSQDIGTVPTHAIDAKDGNFKSLTVKGDCHFDAPIYVNDARADVVILDLSETAQVTLETVNTLTEESIDKVLDLAEGATLSGTQLLYKNMGAYVHYVDGQFKFVAAHTHEEQTIGGHTVEAMGFMEWQDTDSLPTSGNWVLMNDVTLPADVANNIGIATGETLNLDLNGKTITLANGKRFYVEGTMNLFDCQSGYKTEGEESVWAGGIITGGTNKTGGAFSVRTAETVGGEHGVLNIYGGRITDNGQLVSGASGGAVYVATGSGDATKGYQHGGELNMYGGEIYANKSGEYGAAITVWGADAAVPAEYGASFNMYGGKIANNEIKKGANTLYAVIFARYNTEINIYDGEISGNTSEGAGGAINVRDGAVLNISGGTFSGNKATSGAVVFNSKANVYITGGTFTGNESTNTSGGGGVVYVTESSSVTQISGGTFTGNTAANGGGAIFSNTNTNVEISGGTFTENSSDKGGALYVNGGGQFTITGGTFTGNEAVYDSTASNKDATGRGGMIFVANGTANIKNITISGNLARRGGAINTAGESGAKKAFVNMENCILTGNTAGVGKVTMYGSAITMASNSSVTLKDTTITGNINDNSSSDGAWRPGGAVWFESGSAKMILQGKVVVANNTVTGNKRPLAQDIVIQDTADGGSATTVADSLDISGLTAGSLINIYNYQGGRSAETIFTGTPTTAAWQTGWVNYYESSDQDRADPRNVYADSAVKHPIYQNGAWEYTADHVHVDAEGNAVTYKEVSALPDSAALADAAYDACKVDGTYHLALSKDVARTAVYQIPGNVTICLNGHDISSTAKLFEIDTGDNFTIEDCTGYVNEDGEYVAGAMSSTVNNNFGSIFRVQNSGNLTMKGGIVGNYEHTRNGEISGFVLYVPTNGTGTIKFLGGAIQNLDLNTNRVGATYALLDIRPAAVTLEMRDFAIRNCDVNFTAETRNDGMEGVLLRVDQTMTNSIIMDNVVIENNTATVVASELTGTKAPGFYGMMYVKGATAVEMNNTKFIDNEITNYAKATNTDGTVTLGVARAAAMYLVKGSITGSGNEFTGNRVNSDNGLGGVFYNSDTGATINLENSVFKNNYAGSKGGVMYIPTTADLDFANCTFEGNSSVRGGAFYCNSGSADMDFDTCTFTKNTASDAAGVLYNLSNKEFDYINCVFTENSSTGNGGVLYNTKDASIFNLTGCTFTKNSAGGNGGTLWTDKANTYNITDCTFTGNTTNNNGSSLYASGGAAFHVSGSTFTNNSASKQGGVMYAGSTGVTVDFSGGNTFTGNTAQNGGALCLNYFKAINIKGATFTGNTSTDRGGAVFVGGHSDTQANIIATTVDIGGAAAAEKVIFNGNKAKTGGALHIGPKVDTAATKLHLSNSTVTITNTDFINNEATASAGAAWLRGIENSVTFNISNVRMDGNKAGTNSGALYMEGNNTLNLSNTTITNNTSDVYGAVCLATGNVKGNFSGQVVIANNVATSYEEATSDLFFQSTTAMKNGTNPWGYVDLSGLTEGSSIGINMASDRYEAGKQVFTIGDSANALDYVFPNKSDKYIIGTVPVTEDETTTTELSLGRHIAKDGTLYTSLGTAMSSADLGETFVMQVSAGEVQLKEDRVIDLNGHSLKKITVADGKTLKLIDNKTNDYDVSDGEGYGTIGEIVGNYEPYYEDTTSGLKRYVVIETEDGFSAHRVYLAISAKSLRPSSAGVGFTTIFAGDEIVAASGITYGIELSGLTDQDGNPTFAEVMKASFTELESGLSSNQPNKKTVVVYNAINENDQTRWDKPLYGRPFMTIGEQTIYGATVDVNMKALSAAAIASGIKNEDQALIDAVNAMMAKAGVSVD